MNPIYKSRRRNDIIIKALCLGAALFGVTWLALILFTLFVNGLSGINLELFNQVRIDPEVETLVWPNGADFDPATLHEWPANEQAFRELARRWEAVAALRLRNSSSV